MPVFNAWNSDTTKRKAVLANSLVSKKKGENLETFNMLQLQGSLGLRLSELYNRSPYFQSTWGGDLSEFLCPIPRGIWWNLIGHLDKSPRVLGLVPWEKPLIDTLALHVSCIALNYNFWMCAWRNYVPCGAFEFEQLNICPNRSSRFQLEKEYQ